MSGEGDNKRLRRATTKALVQHVEVEIEAVLGKSHITVAQLDALKADELIGLDHSVSEPVALRLNGQVFARGDIVTVDGKFAIRISELES